MAIRIPFRPPNSQTWLHYLTHLGALLPLGLIAWDFWTGNAALAINPIQELTFRTGKAALILLILSLAVTPLQTLFGWRQLIPLRKPLGLWAFFYVALHFLVFIFDNGYFGDHIDVGAILSATFEKRYAFAGFAAFLILIPLAITSTRGWMRRLGRNWKRLHRLVYLATLLAVVHYVWLVKSDIREPLLYGGIVVVLLLLRLPPIRRSVSRLRTRLRSQSRSSTALP